MVGWVEVYNPPEELKKGLREKGIPFVERKSDAMKATVDGEQVSYTLEGIESRFREVVDKAECPSCEVGLVKFCVSTDNPDLCKSMFEELKEKTKIATPEELDSYTKEFARRLIKELGSRKVKESLEAVEG